jgi:hypothetical protein
MKTQGITRLLVGKLRGEHHPDQQLARRQIVTTKPVTKAKAQTAAEVAAFKRSISKLSVRQLQGLHARLSKRLGAVRLAKIMREAKGKR